MGKRERGANVLILRHWKDGSALIEGKGCVTSHRSGGGHKASGKRRRRHGRISGGKISVAMIEPELTGEVVGDKGVGFGDAGAVFNDEGQCMGWHCLPFHHASVNWEIRRGLLEPIARALHLAYPHFDTNGSILLAHTALYR